MIAQRLQIATLCVLTKVVERHNSSYVSVLRVLTAGGQREIHSGRTVDLNRRLYIEQRERYLLARVTVQGIQRAGGKCIVVNLNRRAAIFEDQHGGGLRMNGCIDNLPEVWGAKRWRSVVSYLRGRRFRSVICCRLFSITGLAAGYRLRHPGQRRAARRMPRGRHSRADSTRCIRCKCKGYGYDNRHHAGRRHAGGAGPRW